jgi:hypothetical protein
MQRAVCSENDRRKKATVQVACKQFAIFAKGYWDWRLRQL